MDLTSSHSEYLEQLQRNPLIEALPHTPNHDELRRIGYRNPPLKLEHREWLAGLGLQIPTHLLDFRGLFAVTGIGKSSSVRANLERHFRVTLRHTSRDAFAPRLRVEAPPDSRSSTVFVVSLLHQMRRMSSAAVSTDVVAVHEQQSKPHHLKCVRSLMDLALLRAHAFDEQKIGFDEKIQGTSSGIFLTPEFVFLDPHTNGCEHRDRRQVQSDRKKRIPTPIQFVLTSQRCRSRANVPLTIFASHRTNPHTRQQHHQPTRPGVRKL